VRGIEYSRSCACQLSLSLSLSSPPPPRPSPPIPARVFLTPARTYCPVSPPAATRAIDAAINRDMSLEGFDTFGAKVENDSAAGNFFYSKSGKRQE
jgi:hypothetical protein